ncbi:hypothetical protein BXO88_05220 [Oribacterium sp. C9]|uniref:hypothetical protein n=1 Tax=Oribacterium sp. C9 TaxID=1943579 RepID=UPI00098F8B79|nr:hypothetical protein [Oribacterium sp. C9]OON86945.1 hypothetical protein BXO88_05220 [Oribacterium sp. C9]
MNEKQTRKFGNSGKSSKSGNRPGSFGKKPSSKGAKGKPGTAGKPFYQTKIKGKSGAQVGDYVMISDGKKKITTRINLPNHPFAKKEVGEMVVIKGVEWYLIRIFIQGTAAYNKIFDADTQREHFGY